jgi:hypothetical protein
VPRAVHGCPYSVEVDSTLAKISPETGEAGTPQGSNIPPDLLIDNWLSQANGTNGVATFQIAR